jgi:hypothetical protein
MDTRTILADLKAELNRLNQTIAALESLDGTAPTTTPAAIAAPKRGARRRMSAAGRKRISEAAKARWAAKRKAVAKPAAAKPAPKVTGVRRKMSPAARKKIAEAQRKRWAAQKAAAKKPVKKVTAGKASAKKAKRGSSGAGMMDMLRSVFQ